jgi:hypothetical protein
MVAVEVYVYAEFTAWWYLVFRRYERGAERNVVGA